MTEIHVTNINEVDLCDVGLSEISIGEVIEELDGAGLIIVDEELIIKELAKIGLGWDTIIEFDGGV